MTGKKKEEPGEIIKWVIRIVGGLSALVTFIAVLIDLIEHHGVRGVIVGVYLFFILIIAAWYILFARRQNQTYKEHVIILLLVMINTAIFFLWVATWIGELSCSFYGIMIDSPRPGSVMDGTFTVSGTYRSLPPADSLILIDEATDQKNYWPSSYPIQINQTLQTWSGEFYLGGNSGDKANVNIALVGKSGRALYEYYLKVGKDTNGNWPSISVLTDDIKFCDKVEVVKK
jgi:hypothetical protein